MAEHTQKSSRSTWIRTGIAAVVIAGAAVGIIYYESVSSTVYIDTSTIQAPEIDLSPSQAGTLEAVYVNEGDTVAANQTVARVNDQLIQTTVAGTIISVPDTVGAQVSPGQTVVAMIDPTELRVVGELDENKGLDRIQVGDPITFTVDAFGGEKFAGVIDEISPTSLASQVVFNISDQRQEQEFDVKARFDTSAYPQLKNGMSARMWVNIN